MASLQRIPYDPAADTDIRRGSAYEPSLLIPVACDPDSPPAPRGGSIFSARNRIRRHGKLGLTADGRDGLPTRASVDRMVQVYLDSLPGQQKARTLISEDLYNRMLQVLLRPSSQDVLGEDGLRWMRSKNFSVQSIGDGSATIHHDGKPLVCREQIYEVLVAAHLWSCHGGRDKTLKAVNTTYSGVTKEVIARFVSLCPGCAAWEKRDDAYFAAMDDGKDYPVHNALRALSIAAGHADESTYSDVGDHQPALPPGMTSRRRRSQAPASPAGAGTIGRATSSPAAQSPGPGPIRRTPTRTRSSPDPRTPSAQTSRRPSNALGSSSPLRVQQTFRDFSTRPHYPAAIQPLAQAASTTAGAPSTAAVAATVGGSSIAVPFPLDPFLRALDAAAIAPNPVATTALPSSAGPLPTHPATSSTATYEPLHRSHASAAARSDVLHTAVNASTNFFDAVPGLEQALATGGTVDSGPLQTGNGQPATLHTPAALPVPAAAAVPAPAPATHLPAPVETGATMTEGLMFEIFNSAPTVEANQPVQHAHLFSGRHAPLQASRPSPVHAGRQVAPASSAIAPASVVQAFDQSSSSTDRTVELAKRVFAGLGIPGIGLDGPTVAQQPRENNSSSTMVASERVLVRDEEAMDVDAVSPPSSLPSLPTSSSRSRSSSSRSSSSGTGSVTAGGEAMVPALSWSSSTTDESLLDTRPITMSTPPTAPTRDEVFASVEEKADSWILDEFFRDDYQLFQNFFTQTEGGFGTRPSSPLGAWEGPKGDPMEGLSQVAKDFLRMV